jgi:hypothetical protein
MNKVLRSVLAAVVLCVAAPGSAQAPPGNGAATPPTVPKYRVEFILFAHTDVDVNEELFRDDYAAASLAPPPDLLSAPLAPSSDAATPADNLELVQPLGPAGAAPAESAPFWFRVLRSDELQLTSTYRRLARLSAYRMLAHGGWIQEGLDEGAARPMDLANLGIVNPRGTLRLRLSRFLHLGVDLEYQAAPLGGTAAASADPQALTALAPGSRRYRIVEDRRVSRSGELHYVDHPMFGLLFLISPVAEQSQEVEDDTGALSPAA